jgi:hypothetical protein
VVRDGARRGTATVASQRGGQNVIMPRAIGGRTSAVGRARRLNAYDDEDRVERSADNSAFGFSGAGFAAVAWFGLPLGAFLLWAVILGGTARADCVDAAGRACPAPREAAFTTFYAHLPQFGVAVVLSIVVALGIRFVSPFWKAATVGFAAAVVGGGATTVLFTVLNSGTI